MATRGIHYAVLYNFESWENDMVEAVRQIPEWRRDTEIDKNNRTHILIPMYIFVYICLKYLYEVERGLHRNHIE